MIACPWRTNVVVAAVAVSLAMPSASGWAEARKAHVVFVTGDDEYRGEMTMPFIAGLLEREKSKAFKCTALHAVDRGTGQRNPKYGKHIKGREARSDQWGWEAPETR